MRLTTFAVIVALLGIMLFDVASIPPRKPAYAPASVATTQGYRLQCVLHPASGAVEMWTNGKGSYIFRDVPTTQPIR